MSKVLLGIGVEFIFNGKKHEIIEELNDGSFYMQSNEKDREITKITRMEFLRHLEKNEIVLPEFENVIIPLESGMYAYRFEDFERVPEKKQKQALLKKEIIKPLLERKHSVKEIQEHINELKSDPEIQLRMNECNLKFQISTIYRWIKQYKKDEQITSLVSKKRGNYERRPFGTITENIIRKQVYKFLQYELESIDTCYSKIYTEISQWNEKHHKYPEVIPSRKTIARRITKGKAFFEANKKNKKAKNLKAKDKPSYAMKVAQCDHTRLDIIVVDDESGKPLGRPWLTYIMDEYSGYPLGFYLGYEGPSYKSVMYALRNAFKTKGYIKEHFKDIKNDWLAHGVPETLLVDNGKEFHSNSLKSVCQHFDINLKFCTPGKPWQKGAVERFFGTLNTSLLHQMPGTTLSNIQELKRFDYDPKKNAIIKFSQLMELFLEWLIDDFSVDYHKGVKGVPKELWEVSSKNGSLVSIGKFGPEWEIRLYPIKKRRIQHYGIEFEHLEYNSPELDKLRKYLKEKKGNAEVDVKYNPDDLSKIYVYDEIFTKGYIEVPCKKEGYAEGLSLILHKAAVRELNKNDKPVNMYSLIETKAAIKEKVQGYMKSNTTTGGSKGARLSGIGSNKLEKVEATSSTTNSKSKKKAYDPYGFNNMGWEEE
ncbi:putative transposase [Peribacillus simplex]|uniref:Transposase n=1 Tax=Peribacillus simplex TaxID=1478 RepID=A0A9X8WI17_9BACI|nr:Mu transposase C-terminal domain-containing protein [Peribacillus simplex]SIQ29338.1 putative transposase [Peribacillus simplex]